MNWYVVYTHVWCEEKAAEALRKKGWLVHLPRLTKAITRARRRHIVQRPLFPRYLFVRVADRDLYEVRTTNGVCGILSSQGRPVRVSADFLIDLAYAEGCGQFDSTKDSDMPKLPNPFTVGQRVIITEGAFIGQDAVVTEAKPGTRVSVELDLFGRAVSIEIDVRSVQAEQAKAA